MRLYLVIFLAINRFLITLWGIHIGLRHEPSPFCVLVFRGRQDVCKVTRVCGTFLLTEKGKQCSAGISVRLGFSICQVFIRIWGNLNGIINILGQVFMKVGLQEVVCTNVVQVDGSFPGILA